MPPQSSSAAKARYAFDGIRAQIRDLHTETIANLALRARELGDVIALWYGEGDMVTPAFIRDAAKAALRRGAHLLHPQHARLRAAQRGAVGLPEPAARPADPGRAHDGHARRHAGALHGAGAAGRYRHQRRLCRAAMAEHPQRHPPDRRRAAPLRARFRRRLAARPRPAVRDLRCAHPRHLPVDAVATRPAGRRPARRCEALLDFSRRTGIWIISDEVYGRLYFDGGVAPSILQVAEDGDRVLSVNSFSKAWAMTGWRIGWLTHPSGVADQLGAMTQYINSGTSGADPGRRGRPPSARASRWSRRSGSASGPGSTSPMTGWPRSPASCCRRSRAAACTPSSRWRAKAMPAAPAPTSSRRRMSGWRPATCSAARRTPSCACASAATAAQIETALERMLAHDELTPREAARRQENRAGGMPRRINNQRERK